MRLSFRKTILIVILLALVPMLLTQAYFINRVDRTAREQVASYAAITSAQIEENFNNIFRSISYSAVYLAENSMTKKYLSVNDPLETYQAQQYLGELFRTVASLEPYLLNAILVDNAGEPIYMYDNNYRTFNAIAEGGWLERSYGNGPEFFLVNTPNQTFPVCVVPVHSGTNVQIGSILIPMNLAEATRSFQDIDSKGQVELYFLGPDNVVISSNTDAQLPQSTEGYTYIEHQLQNSAFRVVCRINDAKVAEDFTFFQTSSLLTAGVMVLLLIVVGLLFNRLIANPIGSLISEVNEIGRDPEKKSISGGYGVQLDPLVQRINRMLENVSALTQEVLENQKKAYTHELMKRESDLYALRNQINPHFLFNTLQSMSGIAMLHGEREVCELAAGMAGLFYYALKGGDTVEVKEELGMLRQYLEIMGTRLQGKFTWSVDVPDSMLDIVIPKMLLQPLVENAMSHGIEKRVDQTGGLLSFVGREQEEYLFFTVEDNGCLSEQALRQLQNILEDEENLYRESRAKNGIGLANIQYRVKILYGSDCGLTVSKDQGLTRFTLKLRSALPPLPQLSS